ncbi:hypothetical protein COO60DRAFT_1664861, partial [Scenedesmus sp. NREL 46B-D3]
QPWQAANGACDEVPFALGLSHPFMLNMLGQFGQEVVHLDATGGTNKNGFTFYVVLVVDEYNIGCPVAALITSSEGADVLSPFL